MVTTTICFRKEGAIPPVYLAGTFTEWQPLVLEVEKTDNSEAQYTFSKTLDIPIGAHQYKFRLGSGDWWVTDDSVQTTEDGQGNCNNFLLVEPEQNDFKSPNGRPREDPTWFTGKNPALSEAPRAKTIGQSVPTSRREAANPESAPSELQYKVNNSPILSTAVATSPPTAGQNSLSIHTSSSTNTTSVSIHEQYTSPKIPLMASDRALNRESSHDDNTTNVHEPEISNQSPHRGAFRRILCYGRKNIGVIVAVTLVIVSVYIGWYRKTA